MNKVAVLLLTAFLFGVLCGCASSSEDKESSLPAAAEVSSEYEDSSAGEETTVFYATVSETESDFGGILVSPENPDMSSPLVVHSSDMPTLEKGDRIRVEFGGQIALSYPGQIFNATVTKAPK